MFCLLTDFFFTCSCTTFVIKIPRMTIDQRNIATSEKLIFVTLLYALQATDAWVRSVRSERILWSDEKKSILYS